MPEQWTQEDLKEFVKSGAIPKGVNRTKDLDIGKHLVIHNGRDETKLEARMRMELEQEQREGKIAWFVAQSINLRLADRTWYKPDFLLMRLDGRIEVREIKGSWKMKHQDDARVKIKVAAEQYKQFVFGAWTIEGDAWHVEYWNYLTAP